MDLIFSAALVALFVIAAAAAWPAIYALRSRAVGDARELNIWQLVRRRKMMLKDFAGRERDLSHAMHRCIGCLEAGRCDASLDSGRADEAETFCPNSRFLDDIAETRRRA